MQLLYFFLAELQSLTLARQVLLLLQPLGQTFLCDGIFFR
jgi:hypothetical protein